LGFVLAAEARLAAEKKEQAKARRKAQTLESLGNRCFSVFGAEQKGVGRLQFR